ncbi:AraC family transcriptional regulator [Paenibacillaceae bacterium]|nr:AraC family transcriptional regulator [Paenibacillaceae bacterium]
MDLYKETMELLNEAAVVLTGPAAGFKVHYWGMNKALPSNPVHKHSFFEICYVMGGQGMYTEEGVHYPLSAGVHICSRPGIIHQIITDNDLDLLYVAFELDEMATSELQLASFRYVAEHGEPWVAGNQRMPTALLWQALLQRQQPDQSLPSAAVAPLAYALLLSFPSLFGKRERVAVKKNNSGDKLLQRAKLYIRDNLSEPLNLHDVASYLNLSERHLSRLFSAGIDESFTDFIRNERIRQATHLLRTSELTIKAIAETTGFSSVHYFTRTFRKIKHTTPAQFRNHSRY